MAELFHECGIAAIYQLPGSRTSPLVPGQRPSAASRLMPRLLLDIQNRGQLAAGMTSYRPERNQLIDTHKDVGTVNEVFQLHHPQEAEKLMSEYEGRAADSRWAPSVLPSYQTKRPREKFDQNRQICYPDPLWICHPRRL